MKMGDMLTQSNRRLVYLSTALVFGVVFNLYGSPCEEEDSSVKSELAQSVRRLKNVDDDEVLNFDPDLLEKLCPPPLTMFNMVDASVSFKVVNCFLGIIIFQLMCENALEVIEKHAFQTVYASVLHKTYKELMILGFLTFVIFFITSDDSITGTFVASFKYANFCLFFVGMAFIAQSFWSCLANYVIKLFVYKSSFLPTKTLHANYSRAIKRCCGLPPFLTFSHGATRMQLFRNIFLSTYDLPDEFSFPFYVGASLDDVTEDLVELLPSSYFVLMALIFFCEYIIRHYPYDIDSFRHPTRRESIPEFDAIFLYGLIGATIFFTYLYLHYICTRATDAIIALKFPNEMEATKNGASRDQRLVAALGSTMVNGGLRRSRSFAKVMLDLRPFMQDSKNAGAEELEEMTRRRREHVKAEFAKAEKEEIEHETLHGGHGHHHERGSTSGSGGGGGGVKFFGGLINNHHHHHHPNEESKDANHAGAGGGGRQLRGTSEASMRRVRRSTSMGQGVKQANRAAHRASTLATAAARTAVKTAVKTKEARKQEKDDAKLTKEALLMAKHAARINTKHKFGASVLIDQLKTPENTWMNENTEKINQVVREHLPGKSIKVVRRCIDSLRLISNFYVAIYICTFIAESHIAEKMTTLTRAGNLVGLVTVIIANTLLDPLVTFEYATIRTMGVVNPLLVGETLEKVADIDRLKQQVALKILVHWRNVADPSFDEATYVPTKEHLHKLVKRAFDDWDEDKGGSLDEREFKAALERAGIFFSNAQVNRLFRAIDCFQYNGSIDCEEFWATLGPVLVKTLEEIQGTATFEPFTNNIDDTLVSLEDLQVATKRRRMLRLAKAEAKAEEDALLVDIYEEGDPEGKFMSLLAHATKGKLTKEQALMGAKFLRTLKNPPDAKQAPGVHL